MAKVRTRKLTPKQAKFVAEYLIHGDATKAAVNAGYSKRTAGQQGYQLLQIPLVASAIGAKQQRLADKYEVTAERVIRELALIGFANMMDYMSLEGGDARVDFSKLDRDQAAAIQEIAVETVGVSTEDKPAIVRTKFKLADKRAALVDLGRHLSLFKEKIEITADDSIAEMLEAARRRVAMRAELLN